MKVKDYLIRKESALTKQADTFIFLYVSAFCVLQASSSSNKYSNAIAAYLMILTALYCFIDGKRLINIYSLLFFSFVAFAFLSAVWSELRPNTLVAANTFLRLFIMSTLLYNYLSSQNKREYILYAFVAAGLTIGVVTLLYYGPFEYVKAVFSGERIGERLYAINEIAAILAVCSLISLWFALFKKRRLYFFPPCVYLFIAIGIGSRAAFFIFFAGLFVLIFFKCKGKARLFFPLAFAAVILVFFVLLKLTSFGGVAERFKNFMAVFSNSENADGSTLIRVKMIKWGFESFLERPVLGHGLESGAVIMQKHGSGFSLFHNQYVEMLSGLGLIGSCLYFSMFLYPFVRLIKPALKGNETSVIAVVILVSIAVLFVFGTDHDQAIPVLLCYCFLEAESLRRKD